MNAPHLLHQVDLPADVVVPEEGNLGDQVVAVALHPEPEPLQVGGAELRLDPHSQQRFGTMRAKPRPVRRRHSCRCVDRPRHELGSAQLHNQP